MYTTVVQYRILFVYYTYILISIPSKVALLFAGLMVFFIFACAKPYKLRRTNAIEAFVLLDLLLVIALFLNLDERSGKSTKALALTLLLLPFLIVLFYIIVKVAKYFW